MARLERVDSALKSDALAAPPEHAVRSVKAFFGLQSAKAHSLWERIKLEPSFDSRLAPALSGLRGPGEDVRRITYESGGYTVDLTIEPADETSDGVVVGQLFEQGEQISDKKDAMEGALSLEEIQAKEKAAGFSVDEPSKAG